MLSSGVDAANPDCRSRGNPVLLRKICPADQAQWTFAKYHVWTTSLWASENSVADRRSQLFGPLVRLFEVGPRRGNHTQFLAQSPLICVKAAPVIGGPIAGDCVSIFTIP
jgi:hypothetical protein